MKNIPTTNEFTDFEKILPRGTNCYQKVCSKLSSILFAAELILRAEALRVIYDIQSLMAKRLPGAELPAGPPKFNFIQFPYDYHKIW